MAEFKINCELKGIDEEFLKGLMNVAADCLERDSELRPMAIIGAPNGIKCIQGHFYGSTDAEVNECKDKYSLAVKAAALRNRATSVVFISEAWTVEETKEGLEAATRVQPRDHPNRKEAVFAIVETYEGNYNVKGTIVRDSDGKPSIPEFEITNPQMSGRMTQFLPDKDFTPENYELLDVVSDRILEAYLKPV